MNKKILSVKDRQELEKNFQILGRGIGKARDNLILVYFFFGLKILLIVKN